jgi:hypothetical protein
MAAHIDPAAPLPERILAAIARASSRRPARADDVIAQLGGDAAATWAALEQLVAERRIATAHLHWPEDDPEPWLAIWPTGVRVPSGTWTGGSHNSLFVRHEQPLRQALRAASTPRPAATAAREAPPAPVPVPTDIEEPDMPETPTARAAAGARPSNVDAAHVPTHPAGPAGARRTPGGLEADVCALLAGRGADDALAVRELATPLGGSDENVRQAVRRLVRRGVLGQVMRKGLNGHAIVAYYLATPADDDAAPAAGQHAAPADAAAATAAAPADHVPGAAQMVAPAPAADQTRCETGDPVAGVLTAAPAGPILGADDIAALVQGLEPEPEQSAPHATFAHSARAAQPTRAPCPSVDDDPVGALAWMAAATAGVVRSPCAQPAAADSAPAARAEFALWDDGRLTICDGDDVLLLAAADTRRLAALLGVPLELAA